MSIKASAALQGLSGSILKLPLVGTLTSNSFYLAFAIVFIIVLIATFIFGDSSDIWTKAIRMLFWGYLVTVVLLLLRDQSDALSVIEERKNKLTEEIFMTTPGSVPPYFVTTRANTPPGYSNNPLISRDQVADLVEQRAQAIAAERITQMHGDNMNTSAPASTSASTSVNTVATTTATAI